ncbi:Hypoxanthine phosphoribosyltransferase [Bifidobacterium mellis]|uniref:Hypoxanthine phosphoribosyltransferase n=2 Tax=Bifidobacterium TaxID=1678 RepID=A0A0F4KV43_9BIFI|nr:Hypoxanthine phosphoribosyltransferase [Bifidobacterium mellis]
MMETMRIADIQSHIDHELVSKERIEELINRTAEQVSRDYRGKNPIMLAVLKGAFNTLAALSQAVTIPVQIEFMSISSYPAGKTSVSRGDLDIRMDLDCDVRGRHILIVEDIIDSGYTLHWLVEHLKERGAASVEIFTLLDKTSRHEVEVDVKYPGFAIPDEFVVGFGLDYDEQYRNLDSIAVLRSEEYMDPTQKQDHQDQGEQS